ncbi:cell wall protein RBR3-like [Ananas comosus]|uniref:Cell wall protein RBR3-like n=1 Tax=Ananas comosus TaxID=4615 RepID=A0A6P5EWU4_ANACO|nr:cell wall protein RBR3-like [Ananas comosus]XP_020088277.1 cell wall protein RBR3-like [Ananas comosus]XP_020088278.1 cell wall protein RBR3-like [Ananas comosus]
MGANCCVAAKDKPLPSATRCEVSTYRNMRQSPSWSFRWDNRTHIEDIMDNTAQFSQHSSNSSTAASEIKNEAVVENEGLLVGGSSLDAISAEKQRKSHLETGTTGKSKAVLTDQTMESNFSAEEKDPVKPSGKASVDSSKPSTSLPQTPSSSTFKSDPSSSTSHSQLSGPASSKKPRQSDCRSSSDGWSMHLFSELISSSQRERLSFDSENQNSINTSKASRSNTQQSSPPLSPEDQKCKICLKKLKEKSPWSTQKIISTNELSVVAILFCGHVYHSECLEKMTTEADKYDPPCPMCTHGEKFMSKLFAKIESKVRNKASKISVIDIDPGGGGNALSEKHQNGGPGKGLKLGASSSMKGSTKQPFLKRHFSLGSRFSRTVSESESSRKKGFWGRLRD